MSCLRPMSCCGRSSPRVCRIPFWAAGTAPLPFPLRQALALLGLRCFSRFFQSSSSVYVLSLTPSFLRYASSPSSIAFSCWPPGHGCGFDVRCARWLPSWRPHIPAIVCTAFFTPVPSPASGMGGSGAFASASRQRLRGLPFRPASDFLLSCFCLGWALPVGCPLRCA